ncbi:MAG TPA: DUF3300 domain-containing protein [Steroidobacteraceae bacterium]|nr:DUF3300 domain-containing protein [Steroidobacteraceae bacterium]
MKYTSIGIAGAVVLMTALAGRGLAQPVPPPGDAAAPMWSTHWTSAQLEQLAAPIALYPDPLLSSILAASTYPLEVVEAARWLDDPANAALTGDALASALEGQRWDASVKSLVPFAAVLRNMDSNLEWTEQLGDAFLAQPADVMDAVQRLRHRALARGALQSTPQQIVTIDQDVITIEPANPELVYVPYYVPAIYGPWPWPAYAPYDFGGPPGVFIGGALIGFGIGIGFFEGPWGWWGCNWPGHGIVYRPPRPGRPGNPPPGMRPPYPRPPPEPWHHDPRHRDGVPYRDAATGTRYLGSQAPGRHDYRGFPPQPSPPQATPPQATPPQATPPRVTPPPSPRESRPAPSAPTPVPRPSYGRPTVPERPAAPAPRAAAPAFESFGHGPQVRNEAARGSSSRSAPPAPSGGGHPGHR